MANKAKLIEDGIYGVEPAIEGKRIVQFKYRQSSWWDDFNSGCQVLDMAGNVVKVVDDTKTAEECLKSLGYEIIT